MQLLPFHACRIVQSIQLLLDLSHHGYHIFPALGQNHNGDSRLAIQTGYIIIDGFMDDLGNIAKLLRPSTSFLTGRRLRRQANVLNILDGLQRLADTQRQNLVIGTQVSNRDRDIVRSNKLLHHIQC
ncbi:hypothetical protein D3C85_1350470 [compost metagenome]